MGTLDIILLICFIPAIVRGIQKGFVEQLVAIVALLLGAWLAFKFSTPLSTWASGFISLEPKVLQVVSFIVIVVLAVLILNLLGKLITSTLKVASLSWVNRLLGLVFALLKAALVIGLLIYLFDSLNDKWSLINPDTLNESIVYSTLRTGAENVFPYLKEFISGNAAPANDAAAAADSTAVTGAIL